jgi:hypothetical protein
VLLSLGNRLTPYIVAFRGIACALISSIFFVWIFGSHFVLKAIVTAQSSLRVTAKGVHQNA